jgi:integrase
VRLKAGDDPIRERAAAKASAGARVADTFGALVKLHLEYQRQHLRAGSYANTERHLLTHAAPLHGRPINEINRREIAALLASLNLAGNRLGNGAATKKNARAALNALFAWGMSEGLVENNPVIGSTSYEVKSRDRVLSPDELRAVWLAAPANAFGRIIRLLMLLGQRESEIADLRRSELQGDGILLPGERTKNRRQHFVPLPAAAYAIINEQLTQQAPDRELVFAGRGHGSFSNWSKAKRELDAAIAAKRGKPLAPWRIHDLRRSFVTHANEIGVAPHIVEAVVNHQSGTRGGVAGVYNHARYEPEKRTALDRWAEYLLSVVAGEASNVAPLRRGA